MQLQVVEHSDMRVLTTTQLAEAFGTQGKIITRNFQRNQDRYTPNEHYFSLAGDDLKQFKAERPQDVHLKYVSVLYLWTEKGAWLHAKSLKSERAWEAFQKLIDTYYQMSTQIKEMQGDDSKTPALLTQEQIYQIESRLSDLEQQMRESITLHSGEQRRVRIAVGERIYQLATEKKGARPVLFRALYSAIREQYDVDSYRDILQHDLQGALNFISTWGGEACEARSQTDCE